MNDEKWYAYFGVIPIHTSGMADGIILKYPDFYLKIYEKPGYSYEVFGYRYGEESSRFMDLVNINDLRLYAAQFKNSLRKV